jgi:hypothetical protein
MLLAVIVALSGCGSGSGSGSGSGGSETATTASPDTGSSLPGAQLTPPPWTPGTDQLEQRLEVIGLPALPAEAFVVHIHQHLDLFVEGKQVTLPANIGIGQTFISPLHTHDPSGILHVEADRPQTFTLGQFFGVWGVPLSRTQIGGLEAGGGKQVRAWVNGKPFAGDPAAIELASHQELVVAYGTNAQLPKPVPARYRFPPGV